MADIDPWQFKSTLAMTPTLLQDYGSDTKAVAATAAVYGVCMTVRRRLRADYETR